MATIFVTGASGFIGYHLVDRLCTLGHTVVGLDNHNDYYDVSLKEARLKTLTNKHKTYRFILGDCVDAPTLNDLFKTHSFEVVFHLAAQAGVRYSLENPSAYTQANLVGFMNVLEACRQVPPQHCFYASSSSVYGGNTKVPFHEDDRVDRPVSLYAATKKANELLAYSYAHLYGLTLTGLRFFTVYGPFGRPDMAYFSFTKAILKQATIQVFNHGQLARDFTYIDDIVEGMVRLMIQPNALNEGAVPHRIFNIGNHHPIALMTFIETLEKVLGHEANKEFVSMQPGDVLQTFADVSALHDAIGFEPNTSLEEGLKKFVAWYQEYYSEGDKR